MIQILTYSGAENSFKGENVVLNTIHNAQSLDEFDFNIINLNCESLWRTTSSSKSTIESIADIKSLSCMIDNSSKTIVIILLPRNLKFTYREYSENHYIELKNMIRNMKNDILEQLYSGFKDMEFVYENTRTKVYGKDIAASFYFDNIAGYTGIVTQSVASDKPTTVKRGSRVFSFLQLSCYDDIMDFLKSTGLIVEQQLRPEWMEDIKMFDDDKQYDVIRQNNDIIRESQRKIDDALSIIGKNNRYKSILYTSGEELVEVVFDILEKILGCDLSGFEDKKKEDFLISVGDVTFIGEIKGVNSNVRSENVSQLDVHYQSYLEDNPDINRNSVHALLIMDHQKNKAIVNREPVHENQIALAKRNGSLIVETMTLLKLLEKYLNQELSKDQCISILSDNTGLLQL